jgi:hypothetical protein
MAGPSFFVGIIIAMMLGYFWSKEFPFPVLLLLMWAGLTLINMMRFVWKRRYGSDEPVPETMGELHRKLWFYNFKDVWKVFLGAAWQGLFWASLVWFILYTLVYAASLFWHAFAVGRLVRRSSRHRAQQPGQHF